MRSAPVGGEKEPGRAIAQPAIGPAASAGFGSLLASLGGFGPCAPRSSRYPDAPAHLPFLFPDHGTGDHLLPDPGCTAGAQMIAAGRVKKKGVDGVETMLPAQEFVQELRRREFGINETLSYL